MKVKVTGGGGERREGGSCVTPLGPQAAGHSRSLLNTVLTLCSPLATSHFWHLNKNHQHFPILMFMLLIPPFNTWLALGP